MPTLATVSPVTEVPAAEPNVALPHFQRLLSVETDCWDVHAGLERPEPDFVLLDVRPPAAFAAGHIMGAVNIPHRLISEKTLGAYPPGTLFVVYCAGVHCNAADRAAARLAELARPVKKMVGGIAGWKDDGFALVIG